MYKLVGKGCLTYRLPGKTSEMKFVMPGQVLPDCICQDSIDHGLKTGTIIKVVPESKPKVEKPAKKKGNK